MHTSRHHVGILAFEDQSGTADSDRLAEVVGILAAPEQVSALTDAELVDLETELREVADRIIDGTADGIDRNDTERLTEIATALGQVRTEAAARIADAEKNQAEVDALMAQIRAEDGEGDGGDDETEAEAPADDEAAEDAADETDEDVPAEADAELEPVLASASRPTLAEIAARVPAVHRPAPAAAPVRGFRGMATTEHPFIRALERGQNVSLDDFAELLIERHADITGAPANGVSQKFRLGRVDISGLFGDDRTLRSADTQFVNDAKIDAVTAGAMNPDAWTPEIVASGGFCAPTPADYDIMQISGAQRPVRDSLPRFNADRGGIRFSPPPDLSDVLVDQSGGAVGEWSNTTDITPGESTKTCQQVTCNTTTEVFTKAIYRCLGFGNFGARAFPEHVRAWTLNAASAWARKAEQELLDSISTSSVALTSTGIYGYVPELLTHIIQLSAGERSRQRMAPDARLRLLLPAWVPAQMQIDYLRQGSVTTELRTRDKIMGTFSAANVNVAWYEDSRSGAGQVQGVQAAGVELRDLPEIVEWYLFHEGAFTHLDGGTLDLGIVRDSTLNETNDFRIFAENFEEVAFRGIFSYRVRSTLCPSGDRQIAVDGDPCGAS